MCKAGRAETFKNIKESNKGIISHPLRWDQERGRGSVSRADGITVTDERDNAGLERGFHPLYAAVRTSPEEDSTHAVRREGKPETQKTRRASDTIPDLPAPSQEQDRGQKTRKGPIFPREGKERFMSQGRTAHNLYAVDLKRPPPRPLVRITMQPGLFSQVS